MAYIGELSSQITNGTLLVDAFGMIIVCRRDTDMEQRTGMSPMWSMNYWGDEIEFPVTIEDAPLLAKGDWRICLPC